MEKGYGEIIVPGDLVDAVVYCDLSEYNSDFTQPFLTREHHHSWTYEEAYNRM